MDPLVFEPYPRPMVWGGRRLQTVLGRTMPDGPVGESWEISGHPHHVSRVAEGPLRGTPLTDLCAQHSAAVFGPHMPPDTRFPLLIKLLDCEQLLSVQVHPDDASAARLVPGEAGKTEAWVVLAADPGARIYAGLLPGTTRGDVERHLHAGTIEHCLHRFTPRPGDCVFLKAGTVHAVGGGVLLAEVQQTSDATFRLFDWNRVGSDGKPRPLHIRESIEAMDWAAGPVAPVVGSALPALSSEVRGEQLVRCRYFALDRLVVKAAWPVAAGQMSIWMILDGAAELRGAGNYRRAFRRGDTVLIPAAATALTWTPLGPATLLRVTLPA